MWRYGNTWCSKNYNTHGYIHCPAVVESLVSLKFTIIALTSKGFQPQIGTATKGSDLEVIYIPFADKEDQSSDKILH